MFNPSSSATERLLGQLIASNTNLNSTLKQLAAAVAQNTTETAAATGEMRGGGKGGGGKDASGGAGEFLKQITKMLIPVSVVASVIGAHTSGLSVFLSSIKVAGAVVGSLLAPVFLTLSALVLTFADVIAAKILPNFDQFADAILTGMITAIDAGEKAFWQFVDTVKAVIAAVQGVIGSKNETKAVLGMGPKALLGIGIRHHLGDGVADFLGFDKKEEDQAVRGAAAWKQWMDRGGRAEGGGLAALAEKAKAAILGKDGKGGGEFAEKFRANLRLAMAEWRHQAGPQAQQMGIVQAGMTAQMNALSASPFERKTGAFQDRIMALMERAVAKMGPVVVK